MGRAIEEILSRFDDSRKVHGFSSTCEIKNGKYIHKTIANDEQLIILLQNRLEYDAEKIEYLKSENDKIKSATYAQEELQKAIAERDEMREDYYRGFPISKSEKEAIHKFMEEHEKVHPGGHGVSGGKYVYEFCPTGIGTVGTVRCHCGESFTFQDL